MTAKLSFWQFLQGLPYTLALIVIIFTCGYCLGWAFRPENTTVCAPCLPCADCEILNASVNTAYPLLPLVEAQWGP